MESSLSRQGGSRVRFAEEEPGLEVYHPQPVRKAGRGNIPPAAGDGADTGPEVYWAEDNDNDANASKYTFYREGTPTPPEYEESREKTGFGFGYEGAPAASHRTPSPVSRGNPGMFPPFDPPGDNGSGSLDESHEEVPESKKRKYRWVIILLATLFIIVPIAVGAGLGVGLRRPSPINPEGASSASSGGSTSSTTPSSTANSSSSPTPTTESSTNPTNQPPVVTPSTSNSTIYSVPGSTKTFLQVCGIDYSGAGGATDLAHIYTGSMAECMNSCASYDKCTGCGWGPVAGDTSPSHRCWMKNDLRTAHKAKDDYCFGILQS